MPELVVAVALAALIYGGYQLIRRRRERIDAMEKRMEDIVTRSLQSGDYREVDAVLVLHWEHLSAPTRERLQDLRNDLYLKAEK